MMNEYTDNELTVHNQTDMTAVSFSSFSALNLTVYTQQNFHLGAPPTKGGRPFNAPVATRLHILFAFQMSKQYIVQNRII